MSEGIDRELLARLEDARANAYAPYSRFRVAAAIETGEGETFFGCNVETAHFKSVCAEASALSAMAVSGARTVRRVWILADGDAPCPPCGDCRQRLREFGDDRAEILLLAPDGTVARRFRLAELLPDAFGPGFAPRK
jgi:cytidine deaminase